MYVNRSGCHAKNSYWFRFSCWILWLHLFPMCVVACSEIQTQYLLYTCFVSFVRAEFFETLALVCVHLDQTENRCEHAVIACMNIRHKYEHIFSIALYKRSWQSDFNDALSLFHSICIRIVFLLNLKLKLTIFIYRLNKKIFNFKTIRWI